jgi:hypothetical protein
MVVGKRVRPVRHGLAHNVARVGILHHQHLRHQQSYATRTFTQSAPNTSVQVKIWTRNLPLLVSPFAESLSLAPSTVSKREKNVTNSQQKIREHSHRRKVARGVARFHAIRKQQRCDHTHSHVKKRNKLCMCAVKTVRCCRAFDRLNLRAKTILN